MGLSTVWLIRKMLYTRLGENLHEGRKTRTLMTATGFFTKPRFPTSCQVIITEYVFNTREATCMSSHCGLRGDLHNQRAPVRDFTRRTISFAAARTCAYRDTIAVRNFSRGSAIRKSLESGADIEMVLDTTMASAQVHPGH